MPIYEFRCEVCGEVFEELQKLGDGFPPCPSCRAKEVVKLPSIFSFRDNIAIRSQRERAILKRARDYLIDGKIKNAQKFLEKAKNFYSTYRIKKLSDSLAERKKIKGGYIIKPEAVIKKQK